ncbi:sterol desaturase family protein [Falsihalocynthiibacter sp. SS001]|uniref:sterol desaturase family protein n=1 Tax=Falsihalocynthiibacter sp. SS001 TaxID=3349698 RepID=UPI0036D2EF18
MQNETIIRLGVFLGLFAVIATAEALLPLRTVARKSRWPINWALVLIDTLTLRLLALAVPLLAVGAALDAGARGVGVLNHTSWPQWIEVIIAVVILDFAIWLQHLLTHKIPILWRLHQVHHADAEMDVSTAIRFHPVEIALSMLLKIGLVYVLGPSAVAVVLFEVLLNGTSLFNHANLNIPRPIDTVIRKILVTPDMHRVHHSVHRDEHDSNYGFSLSIWDRMFGTYIAQPRAPHDSMEIGLKGDGMRPNTLLQTLMMPFGSRR